MVNLLSLNWITRRVSLHLLRVMQDCVDDIEEDPLPSDDLELSPPPLQPYERPHKRLKVSVYKSLPVYINLGNVLAILKSV